MKTAVESLVESFLPKGAHDKRTLQDAFDRCRHLGMRLSRQRRIVLDLLWSEASHFSARDIFEKLNQQGWRTGHTSVYQNLEATQSAGVIEDLDVKLPDDLLREIERWRGSTSSRTPFN